MRNSPEQQYLNLITKILKNGVTQRGRNGTTRCLIGTTMRFSLQNKTIPLLTTKRIPWKTCLHELLWFIRGQTNNEILLKDNINIWSGNASREFLDSRGLRQLAVNDLGPIYGHQWRSFNAHYTNCHDDYHGQGIDQLQNIINSLQNSL